MAETKDEFKDKKVTVTFNVNEPDSTSKIVLQIDPDATWKSIWPQIDSEVQEDQKLFIIVHYKEALVKGVSPNSDEKVLKEEYMADENIDFNMSKMVNRKHLLKIQVQLEVDQDWVCVKHEDIHPLTDLYNPFVYAFVKDYDKGRKTILKKLNECKAKFKFTDEFRRFEDFMFVQKTLFIENLEEINDDYLKDLITFTDTTTTTTQTTLTTTRVPCVYMLPKDTKIEETTTNSVEDIKQPDVPPVYLKPPRFQPETNVIQLQKKAHEKVLHVIVYNMTKETKLNSQFERLFTYDLLLRKTTWRSILILARQAFNADTHEMRLLYKESPVCLDDSIALSYNESSPEKPLQKVVLHLERETVIDFKLSKGIHLVTYRLLTQEKVKKLFELAKTDSKTSYFAAQVDKEPERTKRYLDPESTLEQNGWDKSDIQTSFFFELKKAESHLMIKVVLILPIKGKKVRRETTVNMLETASIKLREFNKLRLFEINGNPMFRLVDNKDNSMELKDSWAKLVPPGENDTKLELALVRILN